MSAKYHVSLPVLLGLLLLNAQDYVRAEQSLMIESDSRPPVLLELYSSQGCSSCPPAQSWISEFRDYPQLWNRVIPIVFHVDYWDYIGWQDPFANPSFSERQRKYAKIEAVNSVYTPGFVMNGKEWTGWFKGKGIGQQHREQVNIGKLSVKLMPTSVAVDFSPVSTSPQLSPNPKYLNIAILGFDIETNVKRGENARKVLKDNFVVLGFRQQPYRGEINIIDYPDLSVEAKRYAVVVWLTSSNGLTPIQSVGGYLPVGWEL